MPNLTIVAHIIAKADKIEPVKAELLKLIAPSREDQGCVQYDFHQDNENPAHFMFYENWESRELWQEHMATAHLAEFKAATDGMLENLTLHEMTKTE